MYLNIFLGYFELVVPIYALDFGKIPPVGMLNVVVIYIVILQI
jgi:hypothetical protein